MVCTVSSFVVYLLSPRTFLSTYIFKWPSHKTHEKATTFALKRGLKKCCRRSKKEVGWCCHDVSNTTQSQSTLYVFYVAWMSHSMPGACLAWKSLFSLQINTMKKVVHSLRLKALKTSHLTHIPYFSLLYIARSNLTLRSKGGQQWLSMRTLLW